MNDNYSTPDWLLRIFAGWHDPCALNPTGLREFDGLGSNWKDKTFVNPPYSNPSPWVDKAISEHDSGKTIVLLLRVDTSTKWFARLVEAGAHFFWYSGRMCFSNLPRANFASMLVILS